MRVKRTRANAGMTLLEIMVVVAIVGILATMAVVEVLYGTGRARLNNATWEISALSSVARASAMGRGRPNYLVFYQSGGESGVLHFEREEHSGIVDPLWVAVDPTDPDTFAAAGVTVRVHDRLRFTGGWGRGGMRFEALAGFPPMNDPYKAITKDPAGASGLMAACSFCTAGANGSVLGAIRYAPDGTASIETGPGSPLRFGGGAVALAADRPDEAGHPRMIAFSVPTGAVNVIHRD
jgi:prepilin-type N-terminal cleavage/methylation domain-containing protein